MLSSDDRKPDSAAAQPSPLVLGIDQHLLVLLSRMIPRQVLLHAAQLDAPARQHDMTDYSCPHPLMI